MRNFDINMAPKVTVLRVFAQYAEENTEKPALMTMVEEGIKDSEYWTVLRVLEAHPSFKVKLHTHTHTFFWSSRLFALLTPPLSSHENFWVTFWIFWFIFTSNLFTPLIYPRFRWQEGVNRANNRHVTIGKQLCFKIPSEAVIELHPRLPYRLYTIARSSIAQPNAISVCCKLEIEKRSDTSLFKVSFIDLMCEFTS